MSYFDYKTRQIDRLEDNFPRELSDEERKMIRRALYYTIKRFARVSNRYYSGSITKHIYCNERFVKEFSRQLDRRKIEHHFLRVKLQNYDGAKFNPVEDGAPFNEYHKCETFIDDDPLYEDSSHYASLLDAGFNVVYGRRCFFIDYVQHGRKSVLFRGTNVFPQFEKWVLVLNNHRNYFMDITRMIMGHNVTESMRFGDPSDMLKYCLENLFVEFEQKTISGEKGLNVYLLFDSSGPVFYY